MLTKTNDRLKQIASLIAGLEHDRAHIAEEIRDIYDAAKSEGYTPGALKKAIKIHAMDADKRAKHDAEQMDLELYLDQLEGRETE